MKTKYYLLIVLMIAFLFVGACGSQGGDSEAPVSLNLGTHPSGSMIHTIGVSLASVAANNNMTIHVSPYGGPSQWLPEMKDGLVHVGIESSHGTRWAYEGQHTYSEPNDFIRIVSAGVYPIYNGLLVKDNSDIDSVEDLIGKRVATGFGSQIASHMLTTAALATGGVKESDIVSVPVTSISDAIELFRDGAIDVVALPSSSPDVQDLDAGVGVRYLHLANTPEAIAAVQEILPGATVLPVKPGTAALDRETNLVANYFMLLGSKDVPDETINNLLQAWWDNVAQLQETHPAMRNWINEGQVPKDPSQITAPYHPGSISFYKEKGLWTDAHDARQEELLSK